MKTSGTYRAAVALAFAVLTVGGASRLAAIPAQIDAAATQQVIRGFGGATAFLPTTPLTDGDLDLLFGNGPGQIGFTFLRIRLAPDPAWRALELANAKGVRVRGGSIIATPWSPPAEMKSNNALISGSLNASAYADYAKYLNDFANTMAANGAPLYAISIQNEPDIVVTYESCDWTAAQLLAFCRNNAGAITATRVVVPESFQFRHSLSDPILNDPVAAENVDIIGGHIYGAGLAAYPLATAKGKEVWMTEHLVLETDWPSVLATGKEIHDCLATANFNAYLWWYVRRYYGPLGEDSVVTKRGWVMAQFAKFVRPGYQRINATANPAAGVYVSAYKREKLVVVAINQGTDAVAQTFTVTGTTVSAMTPYVTSASDNLAVQPAVPVAGGSFTATLPASSITTFVGDRVLTKPAVVIPPQSHAVAAGSNVVLDVTASGEFLSYQWQKNGSALPAQTNRTLTLTNVAAADAGSYNVVVTNAAGSAVADGAVIRLVAGAVRGRLTNLSTRSLVQSGDGVQIAGLVIAGTGSKQVLVRAAGPALRSLFGVAGVLEDPVIELRDTRTGAVVATNDNWDSNLTSTFTAVGAFAWPAGSKDAAVVAQLAPGNYTATVRGADTGNGIALVEIYDLDGRTETSLINLSTRSSVGTNDAVQIGGFALSGNTARTVLIRATGPSLHKNFGVTGALNDPVIELRRQAGNELAGTSDDWSAELAPHFTTVGAFAWPAESRDAAIATTLEPGAYSVVVRGQGPLPTGVALLEIYAEP